MKLYYDGITALLEHGGQVYQNRDVAWDELISRTGLYDFLESEQPSWKVTSEPLLPPSTPPIGQQEVWAAGVTYLRSKTARMEESKDA